MTLVLIVLLLVVVMQLERSEYDTGVLWKDEDIETVLSRHACINKWPP